MPIPFLSDISLNTTDPTITLFDNSGANTDPNGRIVFKETASGEHFDIKYDGSSDRLEFRGKVGTNENTDLVYINRSLTTTMEVLGGATFSGNVTANGILLTGNTGTVTGTGVDNRLAIWNGTTAIDSDGDFFVSASTLHVNGLQITSHDNFYRETINSASGGESFNASNGWHRIIELSGGQGRGKCRFLIQGGGGTGTPFRFEAIVNTAWSNANASLTILHSSYPNFLTHIRVVRNSTSGKSFVDIKGSGEDHLTVTILPDGSTEASIVNFTNVNTLPTGDSKQIERGITGFVFFTATGTGADTNGEEPFGIKYDGDVFTKEINLPSGFRLENVSGGYAKFSSWVNVSNTGLFTTEDMFFDLDDSSSRFVVRGVNNAELFEIDTSDNNTATFASTVKAYGNSDTIPGLEIYSDSNHGMRILHRGTDGDFSFERRLNGTNTEFLRIGRANGNATFAAKVTINDQLFANAVGNNSHILTNQSNNGSVLVLTSTGDNRTLTLQSDHVFSNGALFIGNNSHATNFRGSSYNFETGNATFAASALVGGRLEIQSGSISDTLINSNLVTSSSTTTTVLSVSGTTYEAAFFDYLIKNGTNVRAGTVMAVHDGTNVEFNETSTVDLGDTSDVTLSVDLVSSNFSLKATTTSSSWTIKALVRAI